MDLVRFLKIGCHFSQHFFVRNPNVDSKTEALPYLVFDQGCGGFRGGEFCPDGGEIHKAFIHAELLNLRADAGKVFHQLVAPLVIKLMVGRF